MNFCCRGLHGPLYRVDGTTRITTISAADLALETFILETSILISMIADDRETFLLGVSCITISLVFLSVIAPYYDSVLLDHYYISVYL